MKFSFYTSDKKMLPERGLAKNKEGGFLEIIVVIIIALVLLNVLGIDIKDVLSKPWVHDFVAYTISLLKIVWQDILEIVAFVKDLAA